MALEGEIAKTASGNMAAASGFWAGSIKPFIAAHPIGVAIVGGVLVGVGAYYLMSKFGRKTSEEETATATS